MAKVAAMTVNSNRKYYRETRNDSISSGRNQKRFFVHEALGSNRIITATLESSASGTYADIGNTEHLLLGGDPAGLYRHQKYDLTRYSCKYHFRNISEVPCFFEIYELVCKTSRCVAASTLAADVIDLIVQGVHDYAGSPGDTANIQVNGDSVLVPHGSVANIMDTFGIGVKPSMSKVFMANYKIVKHAKYKMAPGDDIYWTMRLKDKVFNPFKWLAVGGTGHAYDVQKGYTKILMTSVQGVMGRDASADSAHTIGWLEADVSIAKIDNLTILPMNASKFEHYLQVNMDDFTQATVATAVNPTNVAFTDDDN